MIRYRHDPDNPEKPIVEATPKEIDQLRGFVRSYLRRKLRKLRADGIEDVAQVSLIITWRAVGEGRLRGDRSRTPEAVLRKWLVEVAWRVGMNVVNSAPFRASRVSVHAEAFEGADNRSLPDALIDARRLLEILAGDTRTVTVRAILLLADGATQYEVAEQLGVSRATVTKRIARIRRRLTVIRDHGPWQEPEQQPPRSPRSRKRQR